MDELSVHYFRSRQQVERAAAASATSETARRIHLELAEAYAALIEGANTVRLGKQAHVAAERVEATEHFPIRPKAPQVPAVLGIAAV